MKFYRTLTIISLLATLSLPFTVSANNPGNWTKTFQVSKSVSVTHTPALVTISNSGNGDVLSGPVVRNYGPNNICLTVDMSQEQFVAELNKTAWPD